MTAMLKAPVLADDLDQQLTAYLVLKHLNDNFSLSSAPALTDFEVQTVSSGRNEVDRLQLNVVLDGGLKVRIDQTWPEASFRNSAQLIELADQMAKKVAVTIAEAENIKYMMAEVKESIDAEVARLSSRGIICHIISINLTPIHAATHDLAVVEAKIEVTISPSNSFQIIIKAEDADEVAAQFSDLVKRDN